MAAGATAENPLDMKELCMAKLLPYPQRLSPKMGAVCLRGEEMKYLSFHRWWFVLPIYLLGGLVLGLIDPRLGQAVQQLGMKPGLATAASINFLLPLLAVALGIVHRHLTTAWLGAIGMTGAFMLGLAIAYPQAQPWSAATLLAAVRPVMVMACLGYAALGSLTVLAVRRLLRGYDPSSSTSAGSSGR
jgi:hypothetical protein